jgi:hypothetical protein
MDEDELNQLYGGEQSTGGFTGGSSTGDIVNINNIQTSGGSTVNCDIISQNCPAGYVCQIVESYSSGFSIPTFTAQCVEAPVIVSTCPAQGTFLQCSGINGLGVFAGGESPPGQPCNTFTAAAEQCIGGVECPPVGTFLRCTELQTAVGTIGEFSNGLQNGVCSSYTAIAEQCSTPTPTPTPTVTSVVTAVGKCPEPNSIIRCLDQNGTVLLSTGEQSDGTCGTTTAFAKECRVCPTPGTFLGCIGNTGFGDYAAVMDNIEGPCQTYNVANDPRCPVTVVATWRECDTSTRINGTPPTNYVQSTDTSGACYRQPVIVEATWRECGTNIQIIGTPPTGYTQSTDTSGACYRQPVAADRICDTDNLVSNIPGSYTQSSDARGVCFRIVETWRVCSETAARPGSPPSTYVTAQDNIGICYTPPIGPQYRQCNTTTLINGTPPTNYVQSTDASGVCYREPDSWRECNTNTRLIGTPPTAFVVSSDTSGVCYKEPVPPPQTWRECNTTTPISGIHPADYTVSVDAAGTCYRKPIDNPPVTWRECDTTNSTLGTAPSTYAQSTDTAGTCYRRPIVETWRECGTNTQINGTAPNTYTISQDTSGVCYRRPIVITTPPVTTIVLPPPDISVPDPTTAVVPIPPTPTPTRIVITWRDCISGILNEGTAPTGYRQLAYTGAGGGTCWEPGTIVGFQPSLSDALTFTYQRGGSNLPQPKSITANNPSYGVSYKLTMRTNPDIIVQPSSFIISPRSSQQFFVNVTPALLDKLGDGTSTIEMSVDITEV